MFVRLTVKDGRRKELIGRNSPPLDLQGWNIGTVSSSFDKRVTDYLVGRYAFLSRLSVSFLLLVARSYPSLRERFVYLSKSMGRYIDANRLGASSTCSLCCALTTQKRSTRLNQRMASRRARSALPAREEKDKAVGEEVEEEGRR